MFISSHLSTGVLNELTGGHVFVHPEFSGGITTLTVCNTRGSKLLCSDGCLDRSRLHLCIALPAVQVTIYNE